MAAASIQRQDTMVRDRRPGGSRLAGAGGAACMGTPHRRYIRPTATTPTTGVLIGESSETVEIFAQRRKKQARL